MHISAPLKKFTVKDKVVIILVSIKFYSSVSGLPFLLEDNDRWRKAKMQLNVIKSDCMNERVSCFKNCFHGLNM